MQGTQGRNLETGADTEDMEGSCLNGLFLMVCSICTKDHLPMGGPTHSKLTHSTLITNKENALLVCPQANLVGTFSQFKFPFLNWIYLVSSWQDSSKHTIQCGHQVLHPSLVFTALCSLQYSGQISDHRQFLLPLPIFIQHIPKPSSPEHSLASSKIHYHILKVSSFLI